MVAPRRPHILMGKGQTVSMREKTLQEQVASYLSRMRHTLAFPCSSADAYFGLVPPAVKQWHNEGLFEMEAPLPGRSTNLLSTMFATNIQQAGRRNILHVSVEEADEYLEALRGNRGHEGIFWIEVPEHVPMPRNGVRTPFFLPSDHPFHDAINDWVEQAFKIEDEIDEALERVKMYEQVVKSPAQAVKLWPEMNNFVSFKRGAANNVSQDLRARADKVLTKAVRDIVIEQLARAVMLPEKRPPLQAWVRFFTQEQGT